MFSCHGMVTRPLKTFDSSRLNLSRKVHILWALWSLVTISAIGNGGLPSVGWRSTTAIPFPIVVTYNGSHSVQVGNVLSRQLVPQTYLVFRPHVNNQRKEANHVNKSFNYGRGDFSWTFFFYQKILQYGKGSHQIFVHVGLLSTFASNQCFCITW